MEKSTFSRIEKEVQPAIAEITEQILWESLVEEVRATHKEDDTFDIEQ